MEDLKFKVAIETDRISPEKLIDPGAIGALVEINDQIEKYKNELKELAEVEKEQGRLSEDQKRKQEETRLALKDAQNEYRNLQRSIKTVDEAVQSSITTYDGLVKENKALMEAMRQLPLDDTTGELQKLQAQYNKNNDELKKFDSTLGNHQRNVGNYKSGLGGITDSLAGLPGPIGGAVAGMKTLNTVIKANPIGLIIAAVAGLIAMLSKLQPVVDFITKQFQILTNVVQFFVDNVAASLGIVEKNNITLAETVRITAALADAEVQLREAKRKRIVESASEQLIISELRLAAADMTKSEQERLDILRQIEEVEAESLQKKLRIAAIEFGQAKTRVLLNESTEEDLKNLATLEAELKLLQVESNNFLRENITKRTDLENKVAAEAKTRSEKAAQEREKKLEEERQAIESLAAARQTIDQKMFDNLDKMNEGMLDLAIDIIPTIDTTDVAKGSLLVADLFNNTLKEQTIARLEEEGRFTESMELQKQFRIQELTQMFMQNGVNEYQASLDAKLQADLEYEDQLRQSNERTEQTKRDQTTKTLDLIQFAATAAITIGKNVFGESKALAVAQAIIDSLGAAVGVMRDTKGPLWVRLTNAAVILSAGYANVKKILSTKPGSGAAGGTSAASAVQPPSPFALGFQNEGMVMPQRFGMQSPFATGMASSVGDRFMNRGEINIQANVDRRGLAIAVREGERSIRTQQFDYR
jgi:hypothetical protein